MVPALLAAADADQPMPGTAPLDLVERDVQVDEPVARHLLGDHRRARRVDAEVLAQHLGQPVRVLGRRVPMGLHHVVEEDPEHADEVGHALVRPALPRVHRTLRPAEIRRRLSENDRGRSGRQAPSHLCPRIG